MSRNMKDGQNRTLGGRVRLPPLESCPSLPPCFNAMLKGQTSPQVPKVRWKNPPFIDDIVVINKDIRKIIKFCHPIDFSGSRTERSAEGERVQRVQEESASILGRTLQSLREAQGEV